MISLITTARYFIPVEVVTTVLVGYIAGRVHRWWRARGGRSLKTFRSADSVSATRTARAHLCFTVLDRAYGLGPAGRHAVLFTTAEHRAARETVLELQAQAQRENLQVYAVSDIDGAASRLVEVETQGVIQ